MVRFLYYSSPSICSRYSPVIDTKLLFFVIVICELKIENVNYSFYRR